MWAMKRKVTSMPRVKSSLRRRSGILKASMAAFSSGALSMGLLDSFGGTAREFDLFPRAGRELVRADGGLDFDFALAQNFYRAGLATQHAGDLEFRGADGATGRKLSQVAHVDHAELNAEGIPKTAAIGQFSNER